MARQYYYNESLARTAVASSTTPATKVSLTFTPDASSTYLVIVSGLMDCNNSTVNLIWDLYDGATVLLDRRWRPNSTEANNSTRPLLMARTIVYGASPGSQTLSFRYYAGGTGVTLGIQAARIWAIKLGANDQAQYTTGSTTTSGSTTYQVRTTLTLAAGARNYLIFWSAGIGRTAGTNVAACKVRGVIGGSTVVAECNPFRATQSNTAPHVPWFAFRRLAASGGESITLEYGATATSQATVGIIDSFIIALAVDDFPAFNYIETLAETSNATTTYNDKHSLVFTAVASAYLVLFCHRLRGSGTSATIYEARAQILKDTVAQDVPETAAHVNGQSDYREMGGAAIKYDLTAASVDFDQQWAAENAALTAWIAEAGLYALQLDDTPVTGRGRPPMVTRLTNMLPLPMLIGV